MNWLCLSWQSDCFQPRGQQFESSHRQNFIQNIYFLFTVEKGKRKEKETWIGQFWKKVSPICSFWQVALNVHLQIMFAKQYFYDVGYVSLTFHTFYSFYLFKKIFTFTQLFCLTHCTKCKNCIFSSMKINGASWKKEIQNSPLLFL